VVGVTEVAPFVMRQADGHWHGIAVELWRDIAKDLGVEYKFLEMDQVGLIRGLETGSLDLVVSAMSVTPEREQILDFSHAFFHAGLGIAVPYQGEDNWLGHLWRVLSSRPMIMLAMMCLVITLAGVAVWLLERKRNPEHFGGSILKGVFSGMWWSAQTIAAVGYGDKAVQTPAGRALGLFWMLSSLVITAVFGAVVTSSLTLAGLEGKVRGQQDLDSVRVAVVAHTTGDESLARRHYNFVRFPDLNQALGALVGNKVDALVFDQPTLRYLANKDYRGHITVLPDFLRGEDYALAFPDKSPLREPVNLALLRTLRTERWRNILYNYLGQGADS
jgi:polar amino acid transport system substrate-binding protein